MPRILSKPVLYNPHLEQNLPILFQTANPARANSPEITRQRIREALKATPMPGKVYKVLDHLFDRAGAPDYIAFQRQVKLSNSDKLGIAEELGVSLATVTRAVRLGVQMRWFRVEKRWTKRGRRTLNHYIWCFSPEWHNSSKLTSAPYKEVRNITVFEQQAEASTVTEASVCLPSEPPRKPDPPTPRTPAGPATHSTQEKLTPEILAELAPWFKTPITPASAKTILEAVQKSGCEIETLRAMPGKWRRAGKRPFESPAFLTTCIKQGELIPFQRKLDNDRRLDAEAATREREYQERQATKEADEARQELTPTLPETIAARPAQEARMITPTTPARIPPGVKRKIDGLETLAEYEENPELRAQHQAAADALRARYQTPTQPEALANFAGAVN